MKRTIKLTAAMALIAALASCQKPYQELSPSFTKGTTVSINSGETVELPFTLNDVREGDVVTATAKANSPAESYTVNISMNAGNASGVLTIAAPSAIYKDTPFTVDATFSDKENARFATTTITVNPVIKPLEGLSPTFKAATASIKSGETVTLEFTLNDVRGAKIEAEYSVPDQYGSSISVSPDGTSGTITVTAPKYIISDAPFTVGLTVKDEANGRTGSAEAVINPALADGFVMITEPANCYILAPGAVVGMPIWNAAGEKISSANVNVVWKDNAKLSPDFFAQADGILYFAVEGGAEGNFVVEALKESDNKPFWNWHFWVAAEAPKDVTVGDYTFMDRNIGALTLDEKSELSVGVIYQYGRKNPFPGISFTEASIRKMYMWDGGDFEVQIQKNESENNLEEAVSHPGIYYNNVYFSGAKHNYSWLTTDATTFDVEVFKSLWENGGKKSVYDPCPAGYKVAPKAAWDGVKASATDIQELWDDSYETYDASAIGTNEKYAKGNMKKVQFRGCVYNGLRLTITGEVNSNSTAFSYANYISKPLPTAEVWMADIDPDYASKHSASYFRGTAVKVNTTGNGNYDDISSIKVNALNTTGKYGLNYALPVRCVREK